MYCIHVYALYMNLCHFVVSVTWHVNVHVQIELQYIVQTSRKKSAYRNCN